tara:strand:+ start:1914 stop:2090 length:177 start_codon:yes stop_codon:yes gene_type:complete
MFAIEYEPRIEDPVVVATFNTLSEAEAYMEVIKQKRPRAATFHTIVAIEDEFHNPTPS